jgi:glycosyltransferase involved in cell wall biosynthesis
VLPSHQENFGIAVVEALACNKPVLISNKVNIWREVVDDGAGAAAGDDLAGTAELLRAFLETSGNGDPDRFRSCYRKRFGIDSAAQKMAVALRDSLSWA